jgi:uncharacterized phosphosugar-binding protein
MQDDPIEKQNGFLYEHVAKMSKINELHITMIKDGFEPPVYGSAGIDAMVAVADYVKHLKEVDKEAAE